MPNGVGDKMLTSVERSGKFKLGSYSPTTAVAGLHLSLQEISVHSNAIAVNTNPTFDGNGYSQPTQIVPANAIAYIPDACHKLTSAASPTFPSPPYSNPNFTQNLSPMPEPASPGAACLSTAGPWNDGPKASGLWSIALTTQTAFSYPNGTGSHQRHQCQCRVACACPNCVAGVNHRRARKEKQHICHYSGCGKVYKQTSHLRDHLRWHRGERLFVCNWWLCEKSFYRLDALQRHLRTHTGEKQFVCQGCNKWFNRIDNMKKHTTSTVCAILTHCS